MNKQEYNEKVTELAQECLSLARDDYQGAAVLSEAIKLAFELADDAVDHGPTDVIEHSDNDDAIFTSGHEERLGLQDTVDGIFEELAFWAARADIIERIKELREYDGSEYHFRTKAGSLVIVEADGRVTLDFSDTVRCFSGCKEAIEEIQTWIKCQSPGDTRRDYTEMLKALDGFADENTDRISM